MSYLSPRRLLATNLATPMLSRAGLIRLPTRDAMQTFDQATIDSTGSFLVGQLERLDTTLNEPLVEYTWSRDVPLRTDVAMGDDFASWTLSNFASVGGITPAGKSWVGKNSNAIASVAVDIQKQANPLIPWGEQAAWTVFELASSMQLGRPVDTDKVTALTLKWNMDADEEVYVGDTVMGVTGLLNNTAVTTSNVVNGALGTPTWATKTPVEILKDVNDALMAAYTASGYAVVPDTLLLPAPQWGYLTATLISTAGNQSILSFLQNNSIALARNGRPLEILPLKWLTGAGAGGTDRMVAYRRDPKYVRFPFVPLQRLPLQYQGLHQVSTYYGRLGVVEFRYPETAIYKDGI